MTNQLRPALDRMKSILELEAKREYDNSTVFGGLDRYLDSWLDAVTRADAPLPSPNYGAMSVAQRRAWAGKLLRWISALDKPEPGSLSEGRLSTAVAAKGSTSLPKAKVSTSKTTTAPGLSARNAGEPGGVQPMGLDSPVRYIKGVGVYGASKLEKLGVKTVRELLYLLPHRHLDYGNIVPIARLQPGVEQTVIATLWESRETALGPRMRGTEAIVGDETGMMRAVWFNQRRLWRSLPPQSRVALSGVVKLFRNQPVFESPEYEILEEDDTGPVHTGRLVPVYPLTDGLKARAVRRMVKQALDIWAYKIADPLSPDTRERLVLPSLGRALLQAHYPDSLDEQEEARRRLAFDELLVMQLAVLARRRHWQADLGPSIDVDSPALKTFLDSLPFRLTEAQERALEEILRDISQPVPMARLLQGDVGSGKTVVAAAALIMAVVSGYQGVLMAPTEILAEQHYRSLKEVFGLSDEGSSWATGQLDYLGRSLGLCLLTGSLSQRERGNLRAMIAEGDIGLVVGTHAVIQEEVDFKALGLAVIDEQHRFGVGQRWALRQKGSNPHTLVMSATPIPRSLALSLYGDLDLSIIDELPPGRIPIQTRWLAPRQRAEGYSFIRREVANGRQAFIVCPLIDESPSVEARAATTEYLRLSKDAFPELRLGLLHGRMSSAEKDLVMGRFKDGGLDILVSTPVVEVGIDVPNATVMLIEGADRFGLAQLHQFRGRVGRSHHQSHCLLLSDTPSPEARERLAILESTQDGFVLAEEDLRLRGPGDIYGVRQSGLPELKIASLSDLELLRLAREEALGIFEQDPGLDLPQHRQLSLALNRSGQPAAGDIS